MCQRRPGAALCQEGGSTVALCQGSGSTLISDVLKCSCWRPPRQPRQDPLPGKTESAFPEGSIQQKGISIF